MKTPYRQSKFNGKKMDTHRKVMTIHVGRKLDRSELVHHKNGDKRDNRLENLEIVDAREHAVIHLQKYPDIKNCEACGKEFAPPPNKRSRTKTCSRECRYALTSITNRRPDAPRSMYRPDAYQSEVALRYRRSRRSS